MKKPLANFRYMNKEIVANLKDLKSIMEVKTDRQVSWWMVLPATGDSDSVCVLIEKVSKKHFSTSHRQSVVNQYWMRLA